MGGGPKIWRERASQIFLVAPLKATKGATRAIKGSGISVLGARPPCNSSTAVGDWYIILDARVRLLVWIKIDADCWLGALSDHAINWMNASAVVGGQYNKTSTWTFWDQIQPTTLWDSLTYKEMSIKLRVSNALDGAATAPDTSEQVCSII
jgi:hypothetical protein